MTCRFPRREDSAFSPATAVVSVLRKPGSTKIFAAVVLAAVAIAITITASGLWDDSTLATIFDNPAAPATVIPNVSDVWSITLDAVDSIMSSEWLIPPAFAAINATAVDQTVTEGDSVTITFTVTGQSTAAFYVWGQTPNRPNFDLPNNSADPTVTFTAPDVDEDTTIVIRMTVFDSPTAIGRMSLTILDSTSTVNTSPVVEAGPNLNATRGQEIILTEATATDNEDDDATLTIAWTADPSSAVTFTNATLLNPTVTVSNTAPLGLVTLTLSATDSNGNTGDDTIELTIQDVVVVNTAPIVDAGGPLSVALGSSVIPNPTIIDPDGDSNHRYTWTQDPAGTVTFIGANSLIPTILAAANAPVGNVTLTLTVNDNNGDHTVSDTTLLEIFESDTALPADAFVTTWRTASAGQNITINFVGSGMNITWGDGTAETGVDRSQNHTYAKAGNYTVSVTGGLTGLTLDRPSDSFGLPGPVPELASIDQWGGISWTNMSNAFAGASNMTYSATDTPDLSLVTDMSYMFDGATAFDGDLSSWNVSSVTVMNGMFRTATSFNQPLNSWNVSSVADMTNMFSGATSFNQPLNIWNVSSATSMAYMFNGASSFNQTLNSWDVSSVTSMSNTFTRASSFNGNISNWNVSSVTSMSSMFASASSFDQPLNSWDVSSVTYMDYMFNASSSFDHPLDSWNVSSVIYMNNMFDGATAFDQNLGTWYIVPAGTDFDAGGASFNVTTISAQNSYLRDPNPIYGMGSGGHSDLFEMRGSTLAFKDAPTADYYTANVTASGSIFGSGNNWRVLDITVRGSTNSLFVVLAGGNQTVGEGDTVTLSGSTTDPDGDDITYTWSQTAPTQPSITFVNASASSTTFVAPAVTGDTTFTITLTANNGTQSAEDTLEITVKETGTAFITTWAVSDFDRAITLPMTGTYSVLWGDGIYSPNVNGSRSHTYGVAGDYVVTVLGDGLDSISLYGDTTNAEQLKSIDQWGGTEWTAMDDAFYGAANMVYRATDAPDLSKVTNTSSMFWDASSFDGDLSGWNVSNVTDMFGMFSSASSFNQTLNSWDVSSVTDMSYMFFGASSFDQPLNGWNVSSVTYTYNMFENASSFDQPLNGWNVSSVTDTYNMFENASSFNQPLNDWNVSSVIYMGNMFDGATAFDQNLGTWYVVPDSTSIARSDVPGVVGSISAQNTDLDGHSPVYNVTGSDSTRFAIVNGNQLNMTSVDTKSDYTVNVTASGGSVFEDGNNWRILDVTVTTASDNKPPVITLTGDNPTVLTVGGTYTEQGAVCEDDVDIDKPVTPSGTVNTLTPGSYTLTYSCTDASGNPAADVTRIVRVDATADNKPPVITLTGDNPTVLTVGGTYTEQGAVCEDDVDIDKPVTPSGTVNTLTPGSYTLTYSCTDASGNPAADVTRIVRVDAAADNKPPVITLTGDNPTVLTVGGTYTEQGAVCEDDVDIDKPVTPSGTVNTLTPGSYTLTYSCTDASGNPAADVTRIVRVDATADNKPPVITLTGDNPTVLTVGGTYTEQGAVCEDDVDIDKPVTPSGTVNTLTPGSYTLTYSCTDASGNPAADVTRIVRVDAAADNKPPVITLTGDNPTVLTVGGTYTEQGAVCEDDVDIDKPVTPSGTVNTLTPGSYTLTYSCTDASGNPAADVTRIVRVDATADNKPPVITLTGDNPTVLTVGGTYTEQGAVCEDDVDIDKPVTPSGTVNTLTPGSYTLTYSCTDASGNPAADVTRIVRVDAAADNKPPVITLTGDNPTVLTVGGTYTEQGAVCEDDVDIDKPVTPSGTVNTLTPGSYTLTYSCTDASGNPAADVTRIVRVDATADNKPPVITLTGDNPTVLTVGGTYTEQGAVCEDDVDIDKPVTPSGTVNTLTPGSYTLTYSCADASGNPAVDVTRTVTVQPDTTKPVITIQGANPARIVVNGTYTDAGAACTDAVDGTIIPTVVSNTVDTTQIGTYAVTYSCTDAASNSATQVSRTVIVQTAVIPDTDRSSKSSRSNNTPNPLTTDNSIIIDGQSYDLGSGTTTTTNPYDITTGQATDLVFTAYSPSDIVRFTIYLNLHGDDIKHSDSDTYIRYDHGVVEIVDPHGFISDASITITEDLEQSRKKIINTLVEFEGNMGLTNMAVYIWNEDRRYTSIRIFNALDITSGTETLPDPEPVESDSGLPADPESVAPGFEDDAVDPEHTSSDTPWPDDYDDAQVLTLIRMWSGFESESITDAQLLELLGLEDYQGVDLPDWMMTELGVLVAKGDVTVGEFMLALQYVLTHA